MRLRRALRRSNRDAIRALVAGQPGFRAAMARSAALRSYLRRLTAPPPAAAPARTLDPTVVVLIAAGVAFMLGMTPWRWNRIHLEVTTHHVAAKLAAPFTCQPGQLSRFRDVTVSGNVDFASSALPALCPVDTDSRTLRISGTHLSFERWDLAESTLSIQRFGPALQLTTYLAPDGGDILLDSSAVTISPCYGGARTEPPDDMVQRDVDQWFVSVSPLPATPGRAEISGIPTGPTQLGPLPVEAVSFIRSWGPDPGGSSEIIAGRVRFNDVPLEQSIGRGQRVRLDGLQSGALATITAGDSIRVVLDGVVSALKIDGRRFRPSVLQYLTTFDITRAMLGALGLALTVFLSVWRKGKA